MNSCPIQVNPSSAVVVTFSFNLNLSEYNFTIITEILLHSSRSIPYEACMQRLLPSHWNCLQKTAFHSYQSTASSDFLNSNSTFPFICYNNVILLQLQPLRTSQALQASQNFAAGLRAISLSHSAFLLDSRSSVRKATYLYCHFTDPTKSPDQMRPLLFAPLHLFVLAWHTTQESCSYLQHRRAISNLVCYGADTSLQTPRHLWAPIFCAECRDFPRTSEARDQER
jgi:hypothetical protein